MENKSHALIAGIFTLTLMILGGWFAYWLGKDEIAQTPYQIQTTLKLSGLNPQAAVRYKGIKVGKVSAMDFDEKQAGVLNIQLDITGSAPITRSTYATLAYQGVTGMAYIELDDDGTQTQRLTSSRNQLASIPLRAGFLQQIEGKGMDILTQTQELEKKLNQLLDENNPNSLVHTATAIRDAAQAWKDVPKQVEPSLQALPQTIAKFNHTLDRFSDFSQNAKQSSVQFNQFIAQIQSENGALTQFQRDLDNVTSQLQYETLPRINQVSKEAQNTLKQFQKVGSQLSDNPQSILFGARKPTAGPGEVGFETSPSNPIRHQSHGAIAQSQHP